MYLSPNGKNSLVSTGAFCLPFPGTVLLLSTVIALGLIIIGKGK